MEVTNFVKEILLNVKPSVLVSKEEFKSYKYAFAVGKAVSFVRL